MKSGYDQIEELRQRALRDGDAAEAARLARVLERLDEHRAAYARNARQLEDEV